MDQQNDTVPSTATPKDARKATEEQRRLQEELERRDEDPDGPGLQQTRHTLADETKR